MFNFIDYSKLKLNTDFIKDIQVNPVNDMVGKIQREQQAVMDALDKSRKAKEQERKFECILI